MDLDLSHPRLCVFTNRDADMYGWWHEIRFMPSPNFLLVTTPTKVKASNYSLIINHYSLFIIHYSFTTPSSFLSPHPACS